MHIFEWFALFRMSMFAGFRWYMCDCGVKCMYISDYTASTET